MSAQGFDDPGHFSGKRDYRMHSGMENILELTLQYGFAQLVLFPITPTRHMA